MIAAVAVLAVLYVVAARLMRNDPQGSEGPAIGRTLPYLQLEPLTGGAQAVSLEDLKGRVTVVNYWGTWCPPCRREFPHIVELAARFAGHNDFRLYAVSCPAGDEDQLDALRSETQAFIEAAQVDLPTYADSNGASRKALAPVMDGEQFGYPTTLVLDRSGIIRGMWIGYRPGAERAMAKLVEELLEKSPAKTAGV